MRFFNRDLQHDFGGLVDQVNEGSGVAATVAPSRDYRHPLESAQDGDRRKLRPDELVEVLELCLAMLWRGLQKVASPGVLERVTAMAGLGVFIRRAGVLVTTLPSPNTAHGVPREEASLGRQAFSPLPHRTLRAVCIA